MKKNFGKKNWMFPMPVLMIGTYNEDGTPNMMNAAWCAAFCGLKPFLGPREMRLETIGSCSRANGG